MEQWEPMITGSDSDGYVTLISLACSISSFFFPSFTHCWIKRIQSNFSMKRHIYKYIETEKYWISKCNNKWIQVTENTSYICYKWVVWNKIRSENFSENLLKILITVNIHLGNIWINPFYIYICILPIETVQQFSELRHTDTVERALLVAWHYIFNAELSLLPRKWGTL